jgi:hypothetical protein
VTLTDLVLRQTFDWRTPSHRRALLEDELELPTDDPDRERLIELQARYREIAGCHQVRAADTAQAFRAIVLFRHKELGR